MNKYVFRISSVRSAKWYPFQQGYTDLLILDIGTGGIVVILCKKGGKIWKKLVSKKNNLKKKEKPWGGSKIRNK